VTVIHHSAICVSDVETSLRFWRDGLGFDILMDERFTGDWPTLFGAPSRVLRAIFLGQTATPDAGIVELVDFGSAPAPADRGGPPFAGVLLLSVMVDLDATMQRLTSLGLDRGARRSDVGAIGLGVVQDPDGVLVELMDSGVAANLDRLTGQNGSGSVVE
jgi:glyoxylase I family protein